MKKLLMTTTAIIGASMIAATANAEKTLSVGGNYTSIINMGGDDTANDSMTFGGSTFDMNINASKTTDSGLALSAATSLDVTGAGTNTTANETSAAIAASFGTIGFSNDGGSAAGVNTAEGLSVAWNGFSDQIKGSVPSNAGVGASGNSITYTSPNINGLTFGYTMAENGGNSEVDYEKEGGSFDGSDSDAIDALIDSGHTSYSGFGVKYNIAGLSVAYASASQETSITVKGDDDDNDNGVWSEGWSGTGLSLGYATGPFAVRYSTVTKTPDALKAGGYTVVASTDAGIVADFDTNEVQIGFSYNYGAGTISYVSATEDVNKDGGTAQDATNTILAVSHNLANGLTVGFEQHTANTEIDSSNNASDTDTTIDSASESMITIRLNF